MSNPPLYHVFLPNGEYWLTTLCTSEFRKVGTIVYDPEYKERKFHKWNGEDWKARPLEKLPKSIKALLLIYPISAELNEQPRNNRESTPVYICNWR